MVPILELDLGPNMAAARVEREDGSVIIVINPHAEPSWVDEPSDASAG